MKYPITRLNLTIPNRLHHTPLLITDIFNPIRLPRRHEHMCSESVHASVQLLFFVNFEASWVLDLACLAVVVAIFAIDCRVHFREDVGSDLGKGVGGGARGEESFPLLKHGGEGHLLGSIHGRLGMTVEAGRARHFRAGSGGNGIWRLLQRYCLGELRQIASLGKPSPAYISRRSSFYKSRKTLILLFIPP